MQQLANLSSTSICLKLVHPDVVALSEDEQAALAKQMVTMLANEGIAYDIGAYPHGSCRFASVGWADC